MIAVISAGGKGTRLSEVTIDIPKPMAKIASKPILEHQIDCLKENGIKDIYLLIGYLGNVIKDYFKDGSSFGVNIHYIEEKEPLGSGGGLFFLKDVIKDDFVFVFGDLIFDVYFKRMIDFHKTHGGLITLLSHPNAHPFDSDLIVSNENDLVTSIDSKHNVRNHFYHNLVNSGVYVVSNRIFNKYFQELNKVDFEKDVVKLEIPNGSVYSYHSTEYVKDAGTPDRYYSIGEDIKKGIVKAKNLSRKQKAIFLDRDGTINKFIGFARDINKIELENKAAEGLKKINRSEYISIVITNQPVIARGEVTFAELDEIHKKIETLLGKEGSFYDDLYFCPHHPDSGFEGEIKELKFKCKCRKPGIELILKAAEKYNIDISKSYVLGDTTMDIQTGINAKCKTILVQTGEKGLDGKYNVAPDHQIRDLSEIDKIIGE